MVRFNKRNLFGTIEQNALTYAVAFARIAVFWQQVNSSSLRAEERDKRLLG
jgi:hypothetical protein